MKGMKISISTIFIIIMALIIKCDFVLANEKINFDRLTVEDGLSQGTVTSIVKDNKNNVWIGTNDGLNRYNGYDFKIYKHDEKNKNSLPSNSIKKVKEDNDSNLWILTNYGISKMNIETEIITTYEDFDMVDNLNKIDINDILITENGSVLLATSKGIKIYDKKQKNIKSLSYGEQKNIEEYIYSLEEDDEGNIWVSTQSGINKIAKNNKKIDYFFDYTDLDIKDVAHQIYYDKAGYIWCATYNSGLVKIDKDNNVKKYKSDNSKKSLPSNFITSILRDDYGVLWIGTNNGLVKYNEKSDKFKVYKSKPHDKNSLLDDDILTIVKGYSKSIWVGTYLGISLFHTEDKFYNYSHDVLDNNSISSNKIKSVYEDEYGFIWVATNKKYIDIIDKKNNYIHHINKFRDLTLTDRSVNYITGKGSLVYIGTAHGLIEVNLKTNKAKTYTKKSGLLSNNSTNLFLDREGYLWIASEKGINLLNNKDKTIINLGDFIDKNILKDKKVASMFEDSKGNYYIGYSDYGGLVKINPNKNKVKIYKHDSKNKDSISSSSISSIDEDRNGSLWIGTKNGLNKLEKFSEKFIKYNSKQGLINNNIDGVLIDKNNQPWVKSNNGISILNIKKGIFNNVNYFDLLESNEFSKHAQYINKEGEFLIGGENGLNIFNANELNIMPSKKEIIFDYFKVNGKEYKNIENINLKYNQNNIDINFYLPSYKNKGMSVYKYKLEDEDNKEKWCITNDTKVSYSNLEPGNYTFKVMSNGYNGVENNENSVKFRISPPLWKSNIAKIIYMLIIAAIIYINVKKVKKLNVLVEKRKEELQNEREVSEALLKNIIDLEQNKNKCFVNLSYELRTPITLINATVQLVNKINKMQDGISKESLSYHIGIINKNCKKLLGTINNIIDSTKLENNSYIITLEEKDIVFTVEEAALSLKEYIESKDIELIIDTDVEEKIISCDETEIERCILNLVDNARKFTPNGGYIKVDIKDLNDKVEISVSDNGIGIDKEYQDNIFDRFNQVLDMKKEALKGGSGLGLTITKHIIQKHNGRIYLESEEGKGSKFIITLPTNID
ncbi:two-component regulator propeller domain-containing protein [Romboutsia sedimentorum]|uniref:histidine kinase n=1 Tax=Romboutsia sedimentorum TaxID=1368474 RepID=A0ABT7E6N2_9FIRM|nr:sensor histidine kinase [Romboutsia sedimentorum]MDK2562584.1 two-component regulator propeller domain-containing protein [Romboutsia sedimentorum]